MQQTYEQGLTREELQKLRNNRFGLFLFQLTWILVFVCLIVVNLQLRGNFETWPPPGVQPLGVVLPAIATVGLIISSVLAHRALGALRTRDTAGFLTNWRFTLVLGVVFVLIMAFEWLTVQIPTTAAYQQYSTLFRVMTAFHGVHALVIGLYLWRVDRFTRAGAYKEGQIWPAEAGVKLWDFVTVAWLLFFVVLYVI